MRRKSQDETKNDSAKKPHSLSTHRRKRFAAVSMCSLLLGVNCVAQQQDETLARAHALLEQNKNAEAIAELKSLTVRQPDMKGLQHELGVAYYREGQYLEAARHLQAAWTENSDDRDAAQLLGLSLYSSGKPAEAIPALEQVHVWHPNENIDAIYILGLCYVLTKRYQQAREIFAQLYGLDGDSASAHLLLARILLRQGFDPVAEAEARKALSLSPQLPLGHFTLGEFAVYQANYALAATEFQSELAINGAYAPALTQLGDVYWRLGRMDDAEKVLQRSIWLDSTESEPYIVLGKVLNKKGKLVLAERAFQHALSINPGNYTAHYSLGQLYREQGKAEAAQREMKTAARIQQQQGSNVGRN